MIPLVLGRQKEVDHEVEQGYKKTKLFYLRWASLYPDLTPKGYKMFAFYVNLVYTQFVYYILGYALALYLAVYWGDVDLIAEDVEFLCYTVYYCYAATNALVRRPTLDKLLKTIGHGFFTYRRPPLSEEREILEETRRQENKVTKSYAVFIFIFLAYFVLAQPAERLITKHRLTSIIGNSSVPVNKMMPLRVWTPYDSSTPLAYCLGVASQLVASCMLMAIIVGVDVSFVSLMSQLIGQLKLLNYSVSVMTDRADYVVQNSATSFENAMYESLVENIKHHKILMEYFKKLQSFYGFWLLIIFVGSGLTICSSGFMLSSTESTLTSILTSSFSKALLFMIGLVNVFFYCWYSEELVTESSNFRNMLYGCPWYDCSESFKRTLHIALTCTQKPFQLTATGMIPASLATYSDVLKTAYSYFNLMRASNGINN